jgi:hypothetical protein
MRSALTTVHLGMVQLFPRVLSWVPPRRRGQLRTTQSDGPHTRVLAPDEARYWAWLGQNVPPGDRSGYAYLAHVSDLDGFRGQVRVLRGAASRKDAPELVEAIEARVNCGAVRWAA